MSHPQNPKHVAIIPDGNRRWARERGLAAWNGHEQGARQWQSILRAALGEGITHVTAWMCSMDNLAKRPREEVAVLYRVFASLFDELAALPELDTHRIRVRVLGDWAALQPSSLTDRIRALEERTRAHDGFFLTLLNAYDGVSDMTQAVRAVAERKAADPALDITPATVKDALCTRDLPPADLVIRTGGEPHWSAGFLMWDAANAQLHFSEKLWPDFGADDFRTAVADYRSRGRRHGK